jgi:transposase
MPPNQVIYLKGSSMESFTLGPTPKIDFSFNSNNTWQRLESEQISTVTLKYNSLSTTEFNTEFLQFLSLGAFIYRLQVQMSV